MRSPTNAPIDANASAISSASTSRTSTPREARLDVQAGGEADRQVDQRRDQRHDHHAREVPEQQRGALHRRQREPVQEAGLDVARDRAAGVDRREQRALDERERDREVEIAVAGGKPGMLVAASSPPTLIPIRISGKRIGGMTIAGWRSVCRIERRAIS